MPHYALSIYQPDAQPPSAEQLAPVMRKMNALIEDAKAQRVWVFNGGLHRPSTASVVRNQRGEVVTTDGPYVEGKEHIGGFWIVSAPDLDVALGWAQRAAQVTTLPIEVRPFQDVPEY